MCQSKALSALNDRRTSLHFVTKQGSRLLWRSQGAEQKTSSGNKLMGADGADCCAHHCRPPQGRKVAEQDAVVSERSSWLPIGSMGSKLGRQGKDWAINIAIAPHSCIDEKIGYF